MGFFIFQSNYEETNGCTYNVSVPYWGSLYFNYHKNKTRVLDYLVSVPYWGSLYFNQTNADRIRNMSEFSSPIGVLYISIEIEKVAEKFNNEFPSPIGVLYISMLSNLTKIEKR